MANSLSSKLKLGESAPREVVGSSVIKRFDFQFHRAAEELLKLLQNSKVRAIFCEFHDDYVIEIESDDHIKYKFKQVKTEEPVGDAWDFEYVFGLYKKSEKKSDDEKKKKFSSSFGSRLLQHFIDFPESCESVWLVANVSYHQNLTKLLDEVRIQDSSDKLIGDLKASFELLREASSLKDQQFKDKDFLFKCLKKFELTSIPATCLNTSLTTLKLKLVEFFHANPDVPVELKDIERIAKDLVDSVRTKSGNIIERHEIPIEDGALKIRKAITVDDVLNYLPVTKESFSILVKESNTTLNEVSRIERVLIVCGLPKDLIPSFCRLKVKWDAWVKQNSLVEDMAGNANFVMLQTDCLLVLKLKKNFKDWKPEAESLFKKYKMFFVGINEPEGVDLIIGLMLHLIATSKSISFKKEETYELG